ncbi:MAG: hypothetical protein HY724_02275 [Candidatus Rokubacteria bacterium]|nr:hypothetical protein [Candidatus Rokubacteria bacterium]
MLARIVDKVFQSAPTATRNTKRLLHQSFHSDPRAMIEEVILAQNECMASWELALANEAWQEGREARFWPPPEVPGPRDAG